MEKDASPQKIRHINSCFFELSGDISPWNSANSRGKSVPQQGFPTNHSVDFVLPLDRPSVPQQGFPTNHSANPVRVAVP